jgi:hypothetical protein
MASSTSSGDDLRGGAERRCTTPPDTPRRGPLMPNEARVARMIAAQHHPRLGRQLDREFDRDEGDYSEGRVNVLLYLVGRSHHHAARARRPTSNTRSRGSRRIGSRSRSADRSPPGGDSDPDEPEPATGGDRAAVTPRTGRRPWPSRRTR